MNRNRKRGSNSVTGVEILQSLHCGHELLVSIGFCSVDVV